MRILVFKNLLSYKLSLLSFAEFSGIMYSGVTESGITESTVFDLVLRATHSFIFLTLSGLNYSPVQSVVYAAFHVVSSQLNVGRGNVPKLILFKVQPRNIHVRAGAITRRTRKRGP